MNLINARCVKEEDYLRACFTFFKAPESLIDCARSFADRLDGLFAQRWPGSAVDLFGSCESGLAGPDSDVDLVAHGHGDLARGDPSAIVKVHEFLEECDLDLVGFRQVLNARVPLLQFTARVGSLDIQVDLSLGQPIKRYNSLLLKEYASLDPMSQFLLVIVRSWAKRRGVSTVYREHTPSPYAHALLVVTYLQAIRQLPNLQPSDRAPVLVDDIDVSYTKGLPWSQLSSRPWRNQSGEWRGGSFDRGIIWFDIVADYFAWASTLDPMGNEFGVSAVVSPRLGTVTPKSATNDSEAWRLSIEDPLDHFASARPRDLGDVLNQEGQVKLFGEIHRARALLEKVRDGCVAMLFDPVETLAAPRLPPPLPVAWSEIAPLVVAHDLSVLQPPLIPELATALSSLGIVIRRNCFTFLQRLDRAEQLRCVAGLECLAIESSEHLFNLLRSRKLQSRARLRDFLETKGFPLDVIIKIPVHRVADFALLSGGDLAYAGIAPGWRQMLLGVINKAWLARSELLCAAAPGPVAGAGAEGAPESSAPEATGALADLLSSADLLSAAAPAPGESLTGSVIALYDDMSDEGKKFLTHAKRYEVELDGGPYVVVSLKTGPHRGRYVVPVGRDGALYAQGTWEGAWRRDVRFDVVVPAPVAQEGQSKGVDETSLFHHGYGRNPRALTTWYGGKPQPDCAPGGYEFPCIECGATKSVLFSNTQFKKGVTRRCKACCYDTGYKHDVTEFCVRPWQDPARHGAPVEGRGAGAEPEPRRRCFIQQWQHTIQKGRDADLRTLLESRGLPPDVIAALEAEEVDSVATLALLTEDDLAGIIAPEPRRMLLDVIGVLNGEARGARPAVDPEESAARNLSPSARAWSPQAPAPPAPWSRELDATAVAALRQLPEHEAALVVAELQRKGDAIRNPSAWVTRTCQPEGVLRNYPHTFDPAAPPRPPDSYY
jgi:hypothetical protein